MNLQLFAQEKTEKATPRQRQKARRRGQVFLSRELNSSLVLLFGILLLRFLGKEIVKSILEIFNLIFTDYINKQDVFNQRGLKNFLSQIIIFTGKTFLPLAIGIFSVSVLTNYLQVGFVLSLEPISPKLSRINPLEGLKRIFSRRSLLELIKSITKIIIIAYLIYATINKNKNLFPLIMDMEIGHALVLVLNIAFDIGIKASIALLAMSVLDYYFQWREYEKSLMMSKQDIKEEYKEVEGNPQIKSRIKQIQRQLARSRMLKDVEKADVVITNPTHYAVALLYDAALYSAPVVVAKGVDLIAEKIKEVAEREDVPIVENKPLAQTLYKTVEVGDVIPESLYNAVAEILAFVYSLREGRFKN